MTSSSVVCVPLDVLVGLVVLLVVNLIGLGWWLYEKGRKRRIAEDVKDLERIQKRFIELEEKVEGWRSLQAAVQVWLQSRHSNAAAKVKTGIQHSTQDEKAKDGVHS